MPGGMKTRTYKKRYKAAITEIASKIPASFSGKADRKRWISQVTNGRMQDIKKPRVRPRAGQEQAPPGADGRTHSRPA